jgi:hypothetical protein
MSAIGTERKKYARPTLFRIGGVGQVTLANGSGERLDADFNQDTSFTDLTFTSS